MRPLIITVDEENNEIGGKLREDLMHDDIYRAAGLWLYNENGEVLIAKRSDRKKYSPGKWSMSSAGTVEADESYETNIAKETQEELGLALLAAEKLGEPLYVEDDLRFFLQLFIAKVPSDSVFVLQEEEVAEVRWIDRKRLWEMVQNYPEDFTQGSLRAIQTLLESEYIL